MIKLMNIKELLCIVSYYCYCILFIIVIFTGYCPLCGSNLYDLLSFLREMDKIRISLY